MFEENNRIIIVDDNKEHLLTLAEVFLKTGVGCKAIEYDGFYNNPLKGVRIAFFDINITSKTININQEEFNYKEDPSLSSSFNDLAIAIQSCIHKDNGPYALIFWSSNTSLIENFIEFIRDEQKGYSKLPSPILIDCINKGEFSGDELINKVNSLFKGKSIELLFDFEQKSRNSTSNIIDDFFRIIPKNPKPEDQIWGNYIDFEENFEKVFAKIAISTLGAEYAKEFPDKAILEALSPIHNDLLTNPTNINPSWKSYLTSLEQSEIVYPPDFDPGKLNTIFHIERTNGEKNIRGSVIEISKNNKKKLTSLGINDFDLWASKITPYKTGNAVNDEKRALMLNSSELIAIELSAACDFTNKKDRINKYVLGLITPYIDTKKDIGSRGESSYHVGGCTFNIDNKKFQIWLNLNYVFGTSVNDKRLGKVKFRLKKEIMDMIGNKYAGHISRIGITSF